MATAMMNTPPPSGGGRGGSGRGHGITIDISPPSPHSSMPYEEVERLVRKEKLEEKYDVGAELGRGKFAIVKRVTEKASGEQYAAKFLRKRRGGKACRDDIIVEVGIMRQSMGHHRIIKLREVFESPIEMIIIIELATGGELFRMIAVDPLPEDKARGVVLQLLEGVEHLHSLSIVHLDLKPENILLYRKGQLDIRIADFGLALQIAPGEQVRTLVGTAEYVAPEILNYEPLSIAADMWSIGALTYALLTGYSPFQGETHSDTFCNVSMCEYDFDDEVFDEVSQEAKDFIEGLLQKKPSDRLTATKCLSHPWIKNHNPTVLPMSSTVSSSSPSSVPQSQCLHSSTSSLDSALCLDSNNSSLDPSPSSSASSSFAPRLSGRSGDGVDEEDGGTESKEMMVDVSKWLKEGTVNLAVKRIQMLGPPGSGKTCSRRLLLNEDPPKEDNSTPIACRAVKATRISVEDGCMKEVDAKALLSRLACDLKEAAAKQTETPKKDHGTESKEEPSEIIPTDSPETKVTKSVHATAKADTTESANATESVDAASDRHSYKFRRDIVEAIPKAKANLNCNWVYIVDSGGQRAFQELLPLFTRAASLNIITLDLSKGMDEKLDLQYRIGGTSFSCDSNFSYTNIEFLNNVLSSGAILQLYHTPQSEEDATTPQCPEYFVLGTHSDDAKVTPEKITEFNEVLSSLTSGSEEKGYRIIPAKLGEIIYPVNTMLKSGHARQEECKNLCDTIFYDDASDDTFEMPVRWFAFELTLLEKAGNKSILEMDDVLSISRSLQMNEDDTKLALQHLHNVTIILYYPQVLPNIVFVDPHPILDILSRLLALTYEIKQKFLRHLTKPIPLDSELENLRKKGMFAKSLLDKLKDDHELSKSNFINLLLHLHIIVETQDSYFIPSALPPFGSTSSPPESDIINPLLIVWYNPDRTEKILPVPRGIFPLAVANLMKFKQPKFQFPPDSKKYLRYRDAMSFRVYVHDEHIGTIHFIKKHKHIEIYFETDKLKYCPLICEAVTEAIYSSSVAINLKHLYKLAFACCSTDGCYCIVTNEAEEKVECTLCPKPAVISGHEKYWNWFHALHKCSTEVSDAPHILDIKCLKDVRLSLKEGNFFESKWLDLGDQLGLLPDTLNAIEANHPSDVSRRLRETLVKWLNRTDGVSPSWTSLVQALEAIEEKTIAEHIRHTWMRSKVT